MQPDRAAFRLVLKWPNATEHSRRRQTQHAYYPLSSHDFERLHPWRMPTAVVDSTCPVTTRADGFPGHQKI